MALKKKYYSVRGQIVGERLSGGARTNYATDALGSVTGTLVAAALQNSYAYKPYGAELAKTGVGKDPSFTWIGVLGYRSSGRKYSDVYVRARAYSTLCARWTTVDPLWPDQPTYLYTGSKPTTVTDSSGEQFPDYKYGPPQNDPWGFAGEYFKAHPPVTLPSAPNLDPYGFWNDPFWGYGSCCGPSKNRMCGPGSKTYNCTDEACRDHDVCVGPKIGAGILHWLPCNRKLCNDIKYCWNQYCVKPPYDTRQCAAIDNIAIAFCRSFGGPPPGTGKEWK